MKPVQNLIISVADKITLPEVYKHIRNLVVKPNAQIDDFVEIINCDPALATRIIKIANSRFFGYSRQISTVKQAISLIGVMQLHDLLLSSLAIRAFSGIPAYLINQEAFWFNNIFCGITARLLAKKCKIPASERLFTSGLLHEIGHLVIYTEFPEQLQEIIYLSEQSDKPLYMLEREILGFDYGHVGSEIMRLWHLPDDYCDIAAYHMEPELLQDHKIEIKIVSLARSIMLTEELNPEQSLSSLSNKANLLLNCHFSGQELENIANQAKSYLEDVMDCLWPFSNRNSQENSLI